MCLFLWIIDHHLTAPSSYLQVRKIEGEIVFWKSPEKSQKILLVRKFWKKFIEVRKKLSHFVINCFGEFWFILFTFFSEAPAQVEVKVEDKMEEKEEEEEEESEDEEDDDEESDEESDEDSEDDSSSEEEEKLTPAEKMERVKEKARQRMQVKRVGDGWTLNP